MINISKEEVSRVVANILARIDEAGNDAIDSSTRVPVSLACIDDCRQWLEEVRSWCSDIYYGKIKFDAETSEADAETDKLVREATVLLHSRLKNLSAHRWDDKWPLLEPTFEKTVTALKKFLSPWVTPGRAISPGVRQGIPADQIEAARKKYQSLPLHPINWEREEVPESETLLVSQFEKQPLNPIS